MKLLVTGGLGFIGSHTTIQLLERGYDVVIVDNLVNSKIEVLDKIEKITGIRPNFHQINLLSMEDLRKVFDTNKFDGVIHFAGLKAVNESIHKPLDYYDNNLTGTLNLLKCMKEKSVYNLVFSSSACVYGQPENNPVNENSPIGEITNPYGRTKYFIEEILKDLSHSDENFRITILRYFNPIGAHKSGLIGEDPNDIPNNLMPHILRAAEGKVSQLKIFGNDYDTCDGTAVRDFIHVMDLSAGHIKALEHINEQQFRIINLGTGKGTSVLQLVDAFNHINGDLVKYSFCERRLGDVAESYADASKAHAIIGFKAEYTIEDMCKDAWNYSQTCNKSDK